VKVTAFARLGAGVLTASLAEDLCIM